MISSLVAFLVAAHLGVASPSPSPSPPVSQLHQIVPSDRKDMIVYGQGFVFFVREPDGWTGHAPSDIGIGNASFYRSTENAKTATTIIWIQVMDDDGPDVEGDLAADMVRWKAKNPNVAFEDFSAPNPRYKTFGKLYITPGEDPSYAVYVDPGPPTKLYYIVTMEPVKRRATPDELAAFNEVVASLECMPVTVVH